MKHELLGSGNMIFVTTDNQSTQVCTYMTPPPPDNHNRHLIDKKVKCSQCKKKFATEDEKFAHRLVHHHQPHHIESPRSFSCKMCKKHFSSNANLWKHEQTHRGDTSNVFRCTTCSQTFSQQANLQRHQLVHTKEKPYKCPICGKLFSQQSNVVKHQVTHTKEKKFQCKICSKYFTQLANMQRHQRIHANIRPFTCNICEKSYTQYGNLKKHVLTHNKVKKSMGDKQPISCKHPYTHFETCHRTTEVAAPATTTTSLGQQITNHRQTAEFAFVLDELLKTSNGDAIAANGFNVH